MKKIILGLAKETKHPVDNRVLFTPKQVEELKKEYSILDFVVESSSVRAFSDEEYRQRGIQVSNDLSMCDYIFGIKEVNLTNIIPNKHYFFFGHIAKEQSYNRPLIQEMIRKNISFSDYEYLTDNKGERLCAFGWWAGAVGVYNTLRGYGLRTEEYELRDALELDTLDEMISEVKVKVKGFPNLLITGTGKVGHGACYFLEKINAKRINHFEYLKNKRESLDSAYTVMTLADMVRNKNNGIFDRCDFRTNPQNYESALLPYLLNTSIFIPCHFWGAHDPLYLSYDDLKHPELKIDIIGDVTCDISGGIKSTIKPSTHDNPYYDYNIEQNMEMVPFSNKKHITVMAVDTLPNALPKEASNYFGNKFRDNVLPEILKCHNEKDFMASEVLRKATILLDGQLTDKYNYLSNFAKGK